MTSLNGSACIHVLCVQITRYLLCRRNEAEVCQSARNATSTRRFWRLPVDKRLSLLGSRPPTSLKRRRYATFKRWDACSSFGRCCCCWRRSFPMPTLPNPPSEIRQTRRFVSRRFQSSPEVRPTTKPSAMPGVDYGA